jgi:hypothetical protein
VVGNIRLRRPGYAVLDLLGYMVHHELEIIASEEAVRVGLMRAWRRIDVLPLCAICD